MKDGFTLIELLAVIVILAVIALIATPIVLSIINDTKEQAVVRSAEFYVNAVENKIMQENMKLGGKLNPKECIVGTDGNVTCDGTYLEIEVNGDKPDSGSITYDRGRVTGITLTFGERKVVTNASGELVLEDSGEDSGEEGSQEPKLASGLYDENDNLLISWEDLTSMEYQTITYTLYEYDEETEEEYEIEVSSPILSVSEDGVLRGTYYDDLDEINYSSEYLEGKLVIDDSVTRIDEKVFVYCSNLSGTVIPNSVTSIGDSAFEHSGLTSVVISDSVKSIGESAFEYCSSLTSITIPDSVTSIGDYAFHGCPSLASIKVDSNNRVYDSRNNSNAIVETAKNTIIQGCKNTTIPDSVTSIGSGAFSYSGLTSITIPNSVTSIGSGAFSSCSSLTSITIPNSVTSIGEAAFSGCDNLTSITIPDSVKSIREYTFRYCGSLTSVTIPNSVTSIGSGAFQYSGLTSIKIPDSVTSIGNYAFYDNQLTSVIIGNSVTSIGASAFSYNPNLTTIYYKGTADGEPWGATNATVISDF